jgi:hypothetical protein
MPTRPDPGPVTDRWAVGFGEIAASLPGLPGLVRGLARQFNQFGSVVISDGGIEYDGDEVGWARVTEVRTHRLVGYLFTGAVGKQVQRLPLWWFPGRKLLLDSATHAALTVVAVAADGRLDSRLFTVRIPAEVRYHGVLREKGLSPGIPAALVLADPAVGGRVVATAQAQGVPVGPSDDDALDAAQRRAAAIRGGLSGLIRRLTG